MSKPTYEQLIKGAKMNADCGEHLSPAEVIALIESSAEQVRLLTEQRDAVVAENVALKDALEYVINPDNQPEYHDQGMGCGVEDHGYQRNGYAACSYGWESAMERVYSEVIPDALPETPATSAIRDSLRAEGAEMFAAFCREKAEIRAYNFFSDAALNAEEFARQLRESKGEAL